MADSLSDFTHLYELFSARPAEEDLILLLLFDFLFTLKADAL